MTPTTRRALAVVALVAVPAATVSVVFWLAPRWAEGEGGTFGLRSFRVITSIDPEGALVGDQVSARASVLVNSDAIDPATVRLSARFAPFGLVRTERAVHEDVGRAALVEVVYTLQCVTVDCLYAMERVVDDRPVSRPIRFPPGTLRARARDGSGAERASFRWPEVNLRSRLDESAIDLLETRPASSAARTSRTPSRLRCSVGARPAPWSRCSSPGGGSSRARSVAGARHDICVSLPI